MFGIVVLLIKLIPRNKTLCTDARANDEHVDFFYSIFALTHAGYDVFTVSTGERVLVDETGSF